MKLSVSNKVLLQQFFADKPVKRAYLFGLHTSKEAVKGSVIDILVELDYSKPIGMKFLNYQLELEELLH